MLIQALKGKIHRARVTEANLNYVGSITIDEDLMDAAGLVENEKVHIVNIKGFCHFLQSKDVLIGAKPPTQ